MLAGSLNRVKFTQEGVVFVKSLDDSEKTHIQRIGEDTNKHQPVLIHENLLGR